MVIKFLVSIAQGMPALAHCTADRCASFATLITYAPSGCMKQQMQAGILYYLQAILHHFN
jgi:hypothetical protein